MIPVSRPTALLLPVLKSSLWLRRALAAGRDIWSRPVAEDISVVLARRAPSAAHVRRSTALPALEYLRPSDVTDGTEALDAALWNLWSEVHEAPLDVYRDKIIRFRHWFPAQASVVLVPEFVERISAILGSPFVASLPSRDSLSLMRHDPHLVARARPVLHAHFAEADEALSPRLWLVAPEGLMPLPEAADSPMP